MCEEWGLVLHFYTPANLSFATVVVLYDDCRQFLFCKVTITCYGHFSIRLKIYI